MWSFIIGDNGVDSRPFCTFPGLEYSFLGVVIHHLLITLLGLMGETSGQSSVAGLMLLVSSEIGLKR